MSTPRISSTQRIPSTLRAAHGQSMADPSISNKLSTIKQQTSVVTKRIPVAIIEMLLVIKGDNQYNTTLIRSLHKLADAFHNGSLGQLTIEDSRCLDELNQKPSETEVLSLMLNCDNRQLKEMFEQGILFKGIIQHIEQNSNFTYEDVAYIFDSTRQYYKRSGGKIYKTQKTHNWGSAVETLPMTVATRFKVTGGILKGCHGYKDIGQNYIEYTFNGELLVQAAAPVNMLVETGEREVTQNVSTNGAISKCVNTIKLGNYLLSGDVTEFSQAQEQVTINNATYNYSGCELEIETIIQEASSNTPCRIAEAAFTLKLPTKLKVSTVQCRYVPSAKKYVSTMDLIYPNQTVKMTSHHDWFSDIQEPVVAFASADENTQIKIDFKNNTIVCKNIRIGEVFYKDAIYELDARPDALPQHGGTFVINGQSFGYTWVTDGHQRCISVSDVTYNVDHEISSPQALVPDKPIFAHSLCDHILSEMGYKSSIQVPLKDLTRIRVTNDQPDPHSPDTVLYYNPDDKTTYLFNYNNMPVVYTMNNADKNDKNIGELIALAIDAINLTTNGLNTDQFADRIPVLEFLMQQVFTVAMNKGITPKRLQVATRRQPSTPPERSSMAPTVAAPASPLARRPGSVAPTDCPAAATNASTGTVDVIAPAATLEQISASYFSNIRNVNIKIRSDQASFTISHAGSLWEISISKDDLMDQINTVFTFNLVVPTEMKDSEFKYNKGRALLTGKNIVFTVSGLPYKFLVSEGGIDKDGILLCGDINTSYMPYSLRSINANWLKLRVDNQVLSAEAFGIRFDICEHLNGKITFTSSSSAEGAKIVLDPAGSPVLSFTGIKCKINGIIYTIQSSNDDILATGEIAKAATELVIRGNRVLRGTHIKLEDNTILPQVEGATLIWRENREPELQIDFLGSSYTPPLKLLPQEPEISVVEHLKTVMKEMEDHAQTAKQVEREKLVAALDQTKPVSRMATAALVMQASRELDATQRLLKESIIENAIHELPNQEEKFRDAIRREYEAFAGEQILLQHDRARKAELAKLEVASKRCASVGLDLNAAIANANIAEKKAEEAYKKAAVILDREESSISKEKELTQLDVMLKSKLERSQAVDLEVRRLSQQVTELKQTNKDKDNQLDEIKQKLAELEYQKHTLTQALQERNDTIAKQTDEINQMRDEIERDKIIMQNALATKK